MGPSCIRYRKLNSLMGASTLLTWRWGKLLVSQQSVNNLFLFHNTFFAAHVFFPQMLFCPLFATFQMNLPTRPSRPPNCTSSSALTLRNRGPSLSHGRHQTGMTSENRLLQDSCSDVCLPGWCELILVCRPKFLAGIADHELRIWAEKIHNLWKSLGRKVMLSRAQMIGWLVDRSNFNSLVIEQYIFFFAKMQKKKKSLFLQLFLNRWNWALGNRYSLFSDDL